MLKSLCLSIILLGLCAVWPLNAALAEEKLTEHIIETHENGSTAILGRLRDEVQVELVYYRPDGKLRKVVNLERKSVHAITYYENGNKRMQVQSVDGLPDGQWIIWYKSGHIFSESHFAKGQIYWRKEWDESGRLVRHQTAKDF